MELFKSFDEAQHPRGNDGRFTAKLAADKSNATTDKIAFASNLENFVKNGMVGSSPLILLSQTPKILKKYNIPDNPITIEPSIIRKILSSDVSIRHGHNIPIEYLKNLPQQLENPLAIMKGKDGKKIILTEYLINDNPIIAIIETNKSTGKYTKVNSVRSLYDKEKNKLAEWLNNPEITEYTDKKRTMVLASIGLQLPEDGSPALSSSSLNTLPQDTKNINKENSNYEEKRKKFLKALNYEFCKLVEREKLREAYREAYLDKLGRGYIAYLKKHYPELV